MSISRCAFRVFSFEFFQDRDRAVYSGQARRAARSGSGHLLATWESAPLGERYRVYKKVVGVDNEFILAATVTDTESNLNTFTPGQLVRVRVTAVNDAGESLPSDTIEQTVP